MIELRDTVVIHRKDRWYFEKDHRLGMVIEGGYGEVCGLVLFRRVNGKVKYMGAQWWYTPSELKLAGEDEQLTQTERRYLMKQYKKDEDSEE